MNDTDIPVTTPKDIAISKEVLNIKSVDGTMVPGSTQRSSVKTVADVQHPSTVRLVPSTEELEPSTAPLEPSRNRAFLSTAFKSDQVSTQTSYYESWQTSPSVELLSTPSIPVYLQSEIRGQISVSPIYSQQVSSITVETSISGGWFYPISPSLTSPEASASAASTIPSGVQSYQTEGVTNYPGFEEQTKNNTVATTGFDLNTRPDILEQTTPNTSIGISETQTEESNLNSTGSLQQTTTNTLLEPIINTKNGDVLNTRPEAIIENTKANRNEPMLDSNADTKGLSEADLMFRLNLYGPSGSKNYLRFPIVTGSNGKFLFSPLSNKDSIDIEAKNVKTKNPTTVQVLPASSSVPANSDVKQLAGTVEAIPNEQQNMIEKGPEPIVVDWKTPPTAKPTSFPDGWKVKSQGIENEGTNDSPSGPKVIFSISKRSDAV